MNAICIHCFVYGRVQGVFYRREAAEFAKTRSLTGWVKNLNDGRVELMICGTEKEVSEMEQWLWEGPDAAKVSDVQIERLSMAHHFPDFEVRY